MRIKVQLPDQIIYEDEAELIKYEAEDGTFTMLPRHIDFASSLVPGVVRVTQKDGNEVFLATSRAVLVKQGDLVTISTSLAVVSDSLEDVQDTLNAELEKSSEEIQNARDSLARMEVAIVKKYMEISD
ncbi:MAG: hypothetical protein GY804_05500 [Alphaproteobacteria bacterium]|nr:hypothetical protein [Alphaproteobacteria bacterium]